MKGKIQLAAILLMCGIATALKSQDDPIDPKRYDFATQSCVIAPRGTCQEFLVKRCPDCGEVRQETITETSINIPQVSAASQSAPENVLNCYRENLRVSPTWINTATWVDRLAKIMVVDTLKNDIILYSIKGITSEFPSRNAINIKSVEGTVKNDSDYILKLVGTKIVLLDGELKVIDRDVNFQIDKDGKKNGLGSLYDWVVAPQEVFAFGTVRSGPPDNHQYESGFIQAGISKKPFAINNARLSIPFDYIDYYLVGHKYVAANDNYAFFLKMGSLAELYRVPIAGGSPEKMNLSFPGEFSRVPKLKTEVAGPADAKRLYEEIETYSIPVGIYGYQKKLYLLTRSPEGKGTAWWLYPIDPSTNKIFTRLRLPSTANHLTLVPSPDYWFIFEKGSVRDDRSQAINTLLAVPTQWIVGTSSPHLRSSSGAPQCLSTANNGRS
jgi:hypothetical protein